VVVTDAECHSVAVNGELLFPLPPALGRLHEQRQKYSQDGYAERSCLDPRLKEAPVPE
jgi:hypothetical protein